MVYGGYVPEIELKTRLGLGFHWLNCGKVADFLKDTVGGGLYFADQGVLHSRCGKRFLEGLVGDA